MSLAGFICEELDAITSDSPTATLSLPRTVVPVLCGKSYRRLALVTCLRGAGTWYSPGALAGEGHPPQVRVHHRVRQPVTCLCGQLVRAGYHRPKKQVTGFYCTYLNQY
jgi:hypothetical protein